MTIPRRAFTKAENQRWFDLALFSSSLFLLVPLAETRPRSPRMRFLVNFKAAAHPLLAPSGRMIVTSGIFCTHDSPAALALAFLCFRFKLFQPPWPILSAQGT